MQQGFGSILTLCRNEKKKPHNIKAFTKVNVKKYRMMPICVAYLTLKAPVPRNGQTHSNNSLTTAGELFECVRPFCKVGT